MIKNNKNHPVKTNLSSTQVLKTLKVLLEGEYTMSELIQRLNENEAESIFNNSVISKYINTCRYCGINVIKINNKYFVTKMPFGLKLSDKDIDLLQYLQNCAVSSLSPDAFADFEKAIKKLDIYTSRKIVQAEKGIIENMCSEFEQAIKNQRKVKLILKSKVIKDCIPLDILEKDGRLYFHVICEEKEKNILLSRIACMEVSQEKFYNSEQDNTVIYKLTGDLAKNYNLRDNERIIDNNLPESATVLACNENGPALISRLLRYGELCEVISPKKVRLELKDTVKSALANYGE